MTALITGGAVLCTVVSQQQRPEFGVCLCWVCLFSLCLCGFSPSTPASSTVQRHACWFIRDSKLGVCGNVNGCLSVCVLSREAVAGLLPCDSWDRIQPPCNPELDKRLRKLTDELIIKSQTWWRDIISEVTNQAKALIILLISDIFMHHHLMVMSSQICNRLCWPKAEAGKPS